MLDFSHSGASRRARPAPLDLLVFAAMLALPALFVFTLVACSAAQTAAPPTREGRIVRQASVMGTSLTLEIEAADRATALEASEAALRALEATEARLSTWRDDSELAAVNALAVGTPLRLSAELAEELEQALSCAQRTGGAFDPTIAPLVAAWGLRQGGRRPGARELEAARARVGIDRIELTAGRLTKRARATFEEGAFGKGAGLDAALLAAHQAGARSLTLDLGGQIQHRGAARWIPLAHPQDRLRTVAELLLHDGSLATSGNSERGLEIDGQHLGHLLDPRRGKPAPDFGSLTVLAPTALLADCLSTGLYVLGPTAALAFARETPGVEVVILVSGDDDAVELRASKGVALRAPVDAALRAPRPLASGQRP